MEGPGDRVVIQERVRTSYVPYLLTEAPRGTEEVPTTALAAILARLQIGPPTNDGVPEWLVQAVGNPLTYAAAGRLGC